MRCSPWLRALAAVWAVWLQAALLDPGSFDSCPEHSHHAAASQSAVPAADHMAHAAHQHGADHHGTHSCTCLGACCCAPVVAVPASHVDLPVVATVDVPPPTHRDVHVVAAPRPHSLPFANGPPAPSALTA